MVWFLFNGSNSLKWVDTTSEIYPNPDISGYKIPENEQIAAFSGTLLKHHGNLFVFCNFLTRKSLEICGFFWLSTFAVRFVIIFIK